MIFVSRCPQDPGKTHKKYKALWTWRLVSKRLDYYTTSLFLFLNISVVFPRKGQWYSWEAWDECYYWTYREQTLNLGNSMRWHYNDPKQLTHYLFLFWQHYLFCSVHYYSFLFQSIVRRGRPLGLRWMKTCVNERAENILTRFEEKKQQNVALKLLERQMWCLEML